MLIIARTTGVQTVVTGVCIHIYGLSAVDCAAVYLKLQNRNW